MAFVNNMEPGEVYKFDFQIIEKEFFLVLGKETHKNYSGWLDVKILWLTGKDKGFVGSLVLSPENPYDFITETEIK